MAIVVVGGQAKGVGKTSVAASLIATMPEMRWTAMKISQERQAFCRAQGQSCDCLTADHTAAVRVECVAGTGSDTSRYLAAGALRSLWVRTRVGRLGDAMPYIREELAGNAIVESNSVVQFLEPDLFLMVLDPAKEEFKDSARLCGERADAVLWSGVEGGWAALQEGVAGRLAAGKPQFRVAPPGFESAKLMEFVRARLHRERRY